MRLLQPLAIPTWKWETILVDFTKGFLTMLKKHDSVMVVVDNFSKEYHFILVKSTHKFNDIAHIHEGGFLIARITKGDSVRPRFQVQFKLLEGITLGFRHVVEPQHFIPPKEQQSD